MVLIQWALRPSQRSSGCAAEADVSVGQRGQAAAVPQQRDRCAVVLAK